MTSEIASAGALYLPVHPAALSCPGAGASACIEKRCVHDIEADHDDDAGAASEVGPTAASTTPRTTVATPRLGSSEAPAPPSFCLTSPATPVHDQGGHGPG